MKISKMTLSAAAACLAMGFGLHAEEAEDFARWYFAPSAGILNFEGDQPLSDGFYINPRIGYDINEWWSIEGGMVFAPKLDENFVTGAGAHIFYREDGTPYRDDNRKKSQSKGSSQYFGDTWMAGLYADAAFHFTRWERLDPFLTFGLGINLYGEDVLDGGKNELVARGGIGAMWHINDEWAIRGDFRLLIDADNTEFNNSIDVGVVWYWGAGSEPDMIAVSGPVDSDGDGLTDEYELEIGTDPNNPDTDGDGLTDGEEVSVYKTDPLNPDTDYDGLTDGEEVKKYKTDPLNPDTDKGGVSDGHEVLIDKTNPLDGNDDLMRFELHLLFDYDKADIHREDYAELDIVAKVLAKNPGSTATIEGHADRRLRSNAAYNKKLSERRAIAVRDYFVSKGIDAKRLSAVGYGFDRPQFKPDLEKGTPGNRRVEVYIRGASDKEISDALKK